MIDIVTYANKEFGTFRQLIDNKFDVKVTVLGMGTKWNGYDDKSKGLLKYIETKNDNDIVVFVDGFDSLINRSPDDLSTLFASYDCKVLMSNDVWSNSMFGSQMFGTCHSGYTANAGMYMGYVEYLKILLKETLTMSCSDDQVKMNRMCKIHSFIKVDSREVIFKNIPPHEKLKESCSAIFVSYPGTVSFERWSRAIPEYLQFFFKQILVIFIVALWLLPKRRKQLSTVLFLLTMYYICFADKTCV